VRNTRDSRTHNIYLAVARCFRQPPHASHSMWCSTATCVHACRAPLALPCCLGHEQRSCSLCNTGSAHVECNVPASFQNHPCPQLAKAVEHQCATSCLSSTCARLSAKAFSADMAVMPNRTPACMACGPHQSVCSATYARANERTQGWRPKPQRAIKTCNTIVHIAGQGLLRSLNDTC
jgi:hypothetical protein